MTFSRREVLAGLAALGGCARPEAAAGGIVAAGQPAAVLIYVLAPRRLASWPRRPAPAALRLLGHAADLPELGALAGGGAPASPEAVAALRPALILDYGDLDPRFRAIAKRYESKFGAPYRLLDGALGQVPRALREAGALLGVAGRARLLADAAEAMLAPGAGSARSFYYARGRDGLETGFAGSLATEVLERAGWVNVATGGRAIGRVAREQVVAWDPEVLVTLDPAFARAAAVDPAWRQRRGGARRRLLLLPEHPFGWIDRPPSVNRLLGCAWLRDERGAAETAARFATMFYGLPANSPGLPLPRWLA